MASNILTSDNFSAVFPFFCYMISQHVGYFAQVSSPYAGCHKLFIRKLWKWILKYSWSGRPWGGSVQMAYAISKIVATESPTTDGEYTYVKFCLYLQVFLVSPLLNWYCDF